jgi:hypothetical protein
MDEIQRLGQQQSDIDPKLRVRLLQATFARATWDGLVRHELGDAVWSIRVHDSAENVTERLSCGTYSQRSRLGTIATHSRFPQHGMISRLGSISRLTRL